MSLPTLINNNNAENNFEYYNEMYKKDKTSIYSLPKEDLILFKKYLLNLIKKDELINKL